MVQSELITSWSKSLRISTVAGSAEAAMLDMLRAVGAPATVVSQLEEIVAATKADELILTAYHFDPADRLRGLELLAEAWGLTAV